MRAGELRGPFSPGAEAQGGAASGAPALICVRGHGPVLPRITMEARGNCKDHAEGAVSRGVGDRMTGAREQGVKDRWAVAGSGPGSGTVSGP